MGASESLIGNAVALMFERLPVMMYVVDRDGVIQDVNGHWLSRLGYERQQVLGQSSSKFMTEGNFDERNEVWRQLEQGEDINAWSVQYVTAAGEIVEGVLYGAPLTEAGRLVGAIAAVFDVTQQRLAERARDRLEAELRMAQKLEAIGQIAAGIAHEINTPSQYVSDNLSFLKDAVAGLLPALGTIGSLLAMARRHGEDCRSHERAVAAADLDYVSKEIPDAIEQAQTGMAQIKRIVLAMKEFSHPGADQKEPVDLNHAVEATTTVARNEWKYVAELELKLDPALPVIQAEPSAINQVILNLVVNAAHAIAEVVGKMPAQKGRITVTTARAGGYVEMTVADTGCGIARESLAKIFDPFFTTKEMGKGTGQGLAIVRRAVVERHGGAISVESTVGRGTRFVVRLPIDPGVAAGAVAA